MPLPPRTVLTVMQIPEAHLQPPSRGCAVSGSPYGGPHELELGKMRVYSGDLWGYGGQDPGRQGVCQGDAALHPEQPGQTG